MIKGRLRSELENPLVRGVIEVYRPILSSLLDRPAPLIWLLSATLVVGVAPIGDHRLFLAALFLALVVCGISIKPPIRRWLGVAALVAIAAASQLMITPLKREFMTPLNEGMLMDMPISVPRLQPRDRR